ncbi:MAG: FIST C-terminal domain-containing protein [Oscillospiraceae bacterium]|jgi:hypothetical protein|nr:FIST C-terminal domain-containing protein [Oscillospiraceae bacterium]
MIKLFTAFTEEIDDAAAATEEILSQLPPEDTLPRHRVGIVHCHPDFLKLGVVSALRERISFDLVGCTSISMEVPGIVGPLVLTMTVLASDEVSFLCGASAPVGDQLEDKVEVFYKRLLAGQSEAPAMLLTFVPFIASISGDKFLEKLDAVSGALPTFGAVSISNDLGNHEVYTLLNGEHWKDAMVLLAVMGPVEPIFLSIATLEEKHITMEEHILRQKAVITSADNNLMQTVNNMPAVRYLESIGLAENGSVSSLETISFVIETRDGVQLVRAGVVVTPDGSVACGGGIPVNATLGVASVGPDEVVSTVRSVLRDALALAQGRGMLIYSCAARYWSLGLNNTMEHECVTELLAGGAPYHFIYSGGEIVPETLPDGRRVNNLQNISVAICIL